MKDDWTIMVVILIILAIATLGGSKNANTEKGPASFFSTSSSPSSVPSQKLTQRQKEQNLERQIRDAKLDVEQLRKQIQAEVDKQTLSVYKDIVSLVHVSKNTDPNREYITLKVSTNTSTPIKVTGWSMKSTSTGRVVTIPKGTYLYFTGVKNSEEDIYLAKGETMNIITGLSPIGVSFKINECSGYLEQFQDFVPYISSQCPLPRNEYLVSLIQPIVSNDDCLDYIKSFPRCKVETKPLPINWTYECKNFIENKINYPSCVDTHKADSDFYKKDWRVYLKRNESVWKKSKENIILYDNVGKVVDTLTY